MSEAINWDRYWFRTSAVLPNEGELVFIRERLHCGELSQPACVPNGIGMLIDGQWYGRDFYGATNFQKLEWGDETFPVPEGWRRLSGLPVSGLMQQSQCEVKRSRRDRVHLNTYETECRNALLPYFKRVGALWEIGVYMIRKARSRYERGFVESPVVNWESPDYTAYQEGTSIRMRIEGFVEVWKSDGMPGRDRLEEAARKVEGAIGQ